MRCFCLKESLWYDSSFWERVYDENILATEVVNQLPCPSCDFPLCFDQLLEKEFLLRIYRKQFCWQMLPPALRDQHRPSLCPLDLFPYSEGRYQSVYGF
uniref:Uncharacterized protein n=1 Tax=Octopus bimaculoides TaxID=37653 RepID=A0A0L8GNX7_OCTBM